ncbi:MAG: T9SS type A sorting domain-containing protein [Cytophagales bacterium]|nr:T9SS type A sorting domain-containing protein [Cytophagales bacterium]
MKKILISFAIVTVLMLIFFNRSQAQYALELKVVSFRWDPVSADCGRVIDAFSLAIDTGNGLRGVTNKSGIGRTFDYNVGNSFSLFMEGSVTYGDAGPGTELCITEDPESTSLNVNLSSFPPGVVTRRTMITSGDRQFRLNLELYYTFPDLTNFSATNNAGSATWCPSDQVNLSVDLANSPNRSNIQYVWEYNISSGAFQQLATTTSRSLSRNISSIPNIVNATSSGTKTVAWRVRATAGSFATRNTPQQSMTIGPLPPTISNISAGMTCRTRDEGVITITGITGGFDNDGTSNNYQWFLQTGRCDDPLDASCGTFANRSGFTRDGNLTINGLDADTYYFYVANNGGTLGRCYSGPYIVEVEAYDALAISTVTPTGLSCAGSNDGRIVVNTTGGRPGTLTYQLSPNVGTRSGNQFTNLPAGSYNIAVTDACGPTVSRSNILVEAPTTVTSTGVFVNEPDCINEPNGSILVDANEGSGNYNYRLYRDGRLVDESLNTTASNWEVASLVGGDYSLEIRDAARTSCAGYDESFTIAAPTALSFSTVTLDTIACPGGRGVLHLEAQGGTANYVYRLEEIGTGMVLTDATGNFTDLPPGTYAASVRNNTSCTDEFVLSENIVVVEPAPFSVSIDPGNITCFGQDNGQLTATVGGGNGTYAYQWQFNDGGGWSDYTVGGQGQDPGLTGLFPARYRLQVTDGKNCPFTSTEVTLEEPQPFVVSGVTSRDITCFGADDGRIVVEVEGGWGSYVRAYTTSDWSAATEFDASTRFSAGSYQVRVRDAEGCEVNHPEILEITDPGGPLEASLAFSDYNGFEVSCSGGDDGFVEITVSGGNGGPFAGSGYTFSLDSASFTAANPITGLGEGAHRMFIRDGRGCTIGKQIDFTAPQVFDLSLEGKTDVRCFGDSSGVLTVSASGGLSPYTYAVDTSPYQDSPQFMALTAQSYTVFARDQNDCMASLPVEIVELNPALELELNATDASCFGYSDGSVTALAGGGKPPFDYRWQERPETNGFLEGIPTGWYQLVITDQEGCGALDSAFVDQPPNIDVGPDVTLCEGQTHGVEAPARSEGIQYEWSSGNGFSSRDGSISVSEAGEYLLVLAEPGGCVMRDSFRVATNEVQFEVNFLAATEQVEGDTVLLVETSYPKPDSIQWDFGSSATIVDRDEQYPQVSFAEAGEHTITLTAFLGGCVDTQQKTLVYYPPGDLPPSTGRQALGIAGIKSVQLHPNPTDGNFTLETHLHQAGELAVFVYDLHGMERARRAGKGTDLHLMDFALAGISPGAYVVQLRTAQDKEELRLIVK